MHISCSNTIQVVKRLSQLTGRRIPDPVVNDATTLAPLFHHLLKEINPKAKKLAQRLITDQALAEMPNVFVRPRRETPIDNDKRLGRFKLVQEELKKRGLPPIGRRKAW